LTNAVAKMRGVGTLAAGDMFWISGVSKAVATVVTYPLIRAKAVMQSGSADPSGLFKMLSEIAKAEGVAGLYSGVWILSYKTVLFNSLMMALKQKLARMFEVKSNRNLLRRGSWVWAKTGPDFRSKIMICPKKNKADNEKTNNPWGVAAKGATVVYIDGSWAFLHAAQEHIIRAASQRGEYLVVGVHSDTCMREATGQYPQECYAARVARLREHPLVTSILEDAPWEIPEELILDLGVSAVLSGTVTKTEDTKLRTSSPEVAQAESELLENPQSGNSVDPYRECKKLGVFEEVQSLNNSTEDDEHLQKVARVLFSNVDASIDWRILVADGAKAVFGQNPGYTSSD